MSDSFPPSLYPLPPEEGKIFLCDLSINKLPRTFPVRGFVVQPLEGDFVQRRQLKRIEHSQVLHPGKDSGAYLSAYVLDGRARVGVMCIADETSHEQLREMAQFLRPHFWYTTIREYIFHIKDD